MMSHHHQRWRLQKYNGIFIFWPYHPSHDPGWGCCLLKTGKPVFAVDLEFHPAGSQVYRARNDHHCETLEIDVRNIHWWKYFFQENIVVLSGNRTITSTTILTTGQVVNDQSQPRIQASFWNCIHTATALVQPALVFSYVPNIAVMYHMFFVSIGHLWSLDEDLKRGMMRIIGEM